MDILHTHGWSQGRIDAAVQETEQKYLSLKQANDAIRELVKREDVQKIVTEEDLDVNAALISQCRSDRYSCGRCAFINAMRKHKIFNTTLGDDTNA